MDFSQAAAAVVRILRRPDRLEDVKANINKAIGFMAASGTFAADLVELQHTIDPTLYAQSFDITAAPFERFRKIKYIRPTGFRKYLTWRDSSMVFDDNGCESLNVWYRAGNNIVFKLSALQPTLEIAYYQYHQQLVDDTDEDWMIDQMWPALQDVTLSYSFDDIGAVDEAARRMRIGMDLYRVYQVDLGDGVSHG
jgi:hypothetical protein